jgi:HAD superfamily hydrolase (TIGR01509 family)
MNKLVIFDCDGVLVDSEHVANKVLSKKLKDYGYDITTKESMAKFAGLSMASLKEIVKKDGTALPDHFEAEIHEETLSAFDRNLRPINGIIETLMALNVNKCVASNGSPKKIEHSLKLTNLDKVFNKESIFSAHTVKRAKPHPDLFLHAAEQMGVDPRDCIVVEDSVSGIKAGRMAGMVVLGFVGGSHAKDPNYRKLLEEAGADIIFDDMNMLPRLIGR